MLSASASVSAFGTLFYPKTLKASTAPGFYQRDFVCRPNSSSIGQHIILKPYLYPFRQSRFFVKMIDSSATRH